MKNLKQQLESFANSTYNSPEESEFMEETMSEYYDEKLRKQYSSVLNVEHNIVRESNSADSPKPKNKMTTLLIIIGALVALLLVAFLFNKLNQESSQNYQVASNIDPYYTEIDFSTRGAVSDAAKIVEISNAYEDKDFSQVSSIYSTLESLDIEGNYLHAIGVSLARNNELDEAIKVWNILLETEESKFTYHNVARWFMGRAIIESGENIENGERILRDITPGSTFYKEAQSLLTK